MNETILICAFRYALGRMTYVVGEVADEIMRCSKQLSPNARRIIVEEIDAAAEVDALGMQMDAEKWHTIRNALSKRN